MKLRGAYEDLLRATVAAKASEHQEQCAVIEWWSYFAATVGLPAFALFAIPNAGAGAQSGQAGKMKAEGVRAGVPDLCLAVARNGFHGLYIEMKSADGVVRPHQTEVMKYLESAGYRVVVCYGADRAMTSIKNYLRG